MLKTGILGGGQLGRMLLQAAANYPVETHVMENDSGCPAAHLCHWFVEGSIRNFDDVYAFGKNLDAITIEIENVNVEALEILEKEGKKIYPRPSVLRTIKNKILQKQYYADHGIPTPEFRITNSREEILTDAGFLPAAQKLGEGGYDGRGVQLLREKKDLALAFDEPSVLEKMVDIKKEIAVMVAVNEKGETAIYPPVEMHFDPELNQLDYQLCPAEIDEKVARNLEKAALSVVRNFHSAGLFAIELFIDRDGNVLVNETAPRVHNSGHHTIEGHFCSQFDMLWRIILGYPLGNTRALMSSIMVNIVGADGFNGDVEYEGLEEVLSLENAFVHLYGKKQTRPGRKMGHVTLLGNDQEILRSRTGQIKKNLVAKTI